jgi:hypothetical protein
LSLETEESVKATHLLIVATSTLMACATTSATGPGASAGNDGEGLSCERRVKVASIPEEYAWVKAHYPGATVNMQALAQCAGAPADKLMVTTADGRDLTLHFDISSFF